MIFEEPPGATPIDPDTIAGLKFKHITTRGELDELEQANIEQGLRWISTRRGGDVLSEEFIRTLHQKLFGGVWDWAGDFRLRATIPGIEPYQIAMQLRMLLDDARFWAKEGVYPPLEAAARFHHRMVWIHPFPNGNGRHTRIAADIFLNDYYDHPPVVWAGGYDLQADTARRETYITALRAADAGDFELLLEFVGLN